MAVSRVPHVAGWNRHISTAEYVHNRSRYHACYHRLFGLWAGVLPVPRTALQHPSPPGVRVVLDAQPIQQLGGSCQKPTYRVHPLLYRTRILDGLVYNRKTQQVSTQIRTNINHFPAFLSLGAGDPIAACPCLEGDKEWNHVANLESRSRAFCISFSAFSRSSSGMRMRSCFACFSVAKCFSVSCKVVFASPSCNSRWLGWC